ncbi:hypothetical protein PanWU01x14_367570 [Parasponia andersonii]|uniref:Uncharacterized protein n=1 Tax=Parasponia andersonii TaxID=3476 RepID=A0A2P5A5D5_PARAD|nr:hypothetical protein PanWU01x14_367570 [Parasponia andersonii]
MATSYEEEHPQKAFGWAARDASRIFSPFHFSRRETGEKDVTFRYWTNWVHFKLLPYKGLDIDKGMSDTCKDSPDTYKDSPDSFHFLVLAFQNRLITIKQLEENKLWYIIYPN